VGTYYCNRYVSILKQSGFSSITSRQITKLELPWYNKKDYNSGRDNDIVSTQ